MRGGFVNCLRYQGSLSSLQLFCGIVSVPVELYSHHIGFILVALFSVIYILKELGQRDNNHIKAFISSFTVKNP